MAQFDGIVSPAREGAVKEDIIKYKGYFNALKKADIGMEILLYDREKNESRYKLSEKIIIEPDETWVLNDFGYNRVTLITCTDDGTQRLVVV